MGHPPSLVTRGMMSTVRKQKLKQVYGSGERPRWYEKRRRWEARLSIGVDATGKRKRMFVSVAVPGPKGEKLCQDKLDRLKQRHRDGQNLTTDRTTIGGYTDKWLELMSVEDIAPRTLTNYRNVANTYIVPHLGRRRLSALT